MFVYVTSHLFRKRVRDSQSSSQASQSDITLHYTAVYSAGMRGSELPHLVFNGLRMSNTGLCHDATICTCMCVSARL